MNFEGTADSDISSVSSDGQPSRPIVRQEMNNEMRSKIRKLLEIDNHLIDLKKKKTILEKEKKALSKEIMEWMKSIDVMELKAQNSILKHNVKVSRPLGKKNLTNLLQTFFQEQPEKGEEIRQYIFEHLPEKRTDQLKRVEIDS
jgi:seryl-tRNA synthetase